MAKVKQSRPPNPAKQVITRIIANWLQRTRLKISAVVREMQLNSSVDINDQRFRDYFTSRVDRDPNIPPETLLACISVFVRHRVSIEDCTAEEALELANEARLPLRRLDELAQIFPPKNSKRRIADLD